MYTCGWDFIDTYAFWRSFPEKLLLYQHITKAFRVKFNNRNIFEKTGLNEMGWDLRNPRDGLLKGYCYLCFL